MKKLLRMFGLNSDMQYFQMIVDNVINGNRKDAVTQFKAMPLANRKLFLQSIYGNWNTGLSEQDKYMFIDNL